MAALRIHGYLVSTFVRTAVMACIEKGVDHELVPIAYGREEHAALHAFTRIPVAEHDGLVIAETLAITAYVDEAFDGPALQPAGLAERTRMREWMSRCADYVYRDVVRTVPRDREPTREELDTARAVLERIEGEVGDGPFLVGDALTLADLYLAPQVSNAREKAPELLGSCPSLTAWMAGIEQRESFRGTTY